MTIEVLSALDGIRKRPEMYIGEASNANQLVYEVLDNAIDEALNGYATTIYVNIQEDGTCSIADNGRGFPLYGKDENGKEEYSTVLACSRLHSSGKIGYKQEKLYKLHVGRHGVGLTVVNALSEFLYIETGNKEYKVITLFRNGKLEKVEHTNQSNIQGTCITFKPISKLNKYDITAIEDRLKLIRTFYNVKIVYNGSELQPLNKEQLVRQLLHISENTPLFKVIVERQRNPYEYIELYYTWVETGNLSPNVITLVNTAIRESKASTELINIIANAGSSLNIIDQQICKYRLRAFANIIFEQPVADAQHKIRCINNINKQLQDELVKEIKQQIKNSTYVKDTLNLIGAIVEQRRQKRKQRNTVITLNVDYFKDCEERPGERLYIVEGTSAEGTILGIRNPHNQAIYPLRGKIANIIAHNMAKIVKSDVLFNLLKVIGYDFEHSRLNLQFNQIFILADPDVDGAHIAVLLLLLFYTVIPEVIRDRRVVYVDIPLWGLVKHNDFIPCKNIPDEIPKGYQLVRYKGLGEFNEHQLEKIIEDQTFHYIPQYVEVDTQLLLKNKKSLLEHIVANDLPESVKELLQRGA